MKNNKTKLKKNGPPTNYKIWFKISKHADLRRPGDGRGVLGFGHIVVRKAPDCD